MDILHVMLCFMLICNTFQIKIATYNLWNIMFNWEIRKLRISQLIQESGADIIAFQEVRSHESNSISETKNQIQELKDIVPQYAYSMYHSVGDVRFKEETYWKTYPREGIGILSRLPIIESHIQNLTESSGPDTNKRIVLHAKIKLSEMIVTNVAVVHFSYDKLQQCSNAVELYKYLQDNKLSNVVVLGDFNAYDGFADPVEVFTGYGYSPKKRDQNKCLNMFNIPQKKIGAMIDTWTSLYLHEKGLTFSNMPVPGLESRPDRILVSSNINIQSAQLLGDGKIYKQKYFLHIIWNRLEKVIATARDAFQGHHGRSCSYDCGPHASCRCGVCVSGGDKNTCNLPNCDECSSSMFIYFILCIIVFILLVAQLIVGMLQVLRTMNKRGNYDLPRLCGCNCCLCNEELYYQLNVKMRRTFSHRMFKLWPVFQLPPMFQVIISMLLLFMYFEVAMFLFKDSIDDIYALIPEEMYPSDHRLLVIDVEM